MRIAIDHSPLVQTHKLAHKIRGTGFYTKNLIEALKRYHPEHEYILFTQGEKLTNVDIYHFPYFDPFFISLPLKRLGKTIITIHDLTPLVFPNLFPAGIKGGLKLQLQKMLAKRADAIITDSESSKKDIERLFHIKNKLVFSVPLAASEVYTKKKISKTEHDAVLKKYNIPAKFALYVGDATPNKNLKRLVDAVIDSEIQLVLVGGALKNENINVNHPWNKDLYYVQEAAIKHKNLHILGFIPDEDLVSLYNLATVFVFPSLYEGFGLPVLEAASCAVPIITSHGGSIPEVIADACTYVDPYNTSEIQNAILAVYENPALQKKMGEEAFVQSQKFTWEKTADQTVKVYEKVFAQT